MHSGTSFPNAGILRSRHMSLNVSPARYRILPFMYKSQAGDFFAPGHLKTPGFDPDIPNCHKCWQKSTPIHTASFVLLEFGANVFFRAHAVPPALQHDTACVLYWSQCSVIILISRMFEKKGVGGRYKITFGVGNFYLPQKGRYW